MSNASQVRAQIENANAGLLAMNAIRQLKHDVRGSHILDALSLEGSSALPLDLLSETLSDDPVAQRLVSGLGVTGAPDDGGAYETALRLALAAHLLTSRSTGIDDHAEGLQKWRLKRVLSYIDGRLGDPITLADLAAAAGLSRMYFAARFRSSTGLRPHDYVLRRRVERAKELLVQTDESLVAIALDVGFQTQAHFTTVFKKVVGLTPGKWRSVNRAVAKAA